MIFSRGSVRRRLVADGVHEVRLPQARSAVDVQRIVGPGRVLGHGGAGGVGELVARADDEVLEGIVRVQVRVEEHPVLRPALVGRFAHEAERRFVEDVFDLEDLSEELLRGLVDHRRVMEGQPVLEVRVGDLDVKVCRAPGRCTPSARTRFRSCSGRSSAGLQRGFEAKDSSFLPFALRLDIFPQIFSQLWKNTPP